MRPSGSACRVPVRHGSRSRTRTRADARPEPAPRPRRAALSVLALALLAAPGCSPAEPEGLLAVVQREFDWTREQSAGAPASLHWSWLDGQPLGEWQAVAGTSLAPTPAGLVLEAAERAQLEGPAASPIDPGLHHVLSFRARCAGVRRVVVQWRGPGQDYTTERSFWWLSELAGPDGFVTYSVRVESLRATWRQQDDAIAGIERLRLGFVAEDGQTARVELQSLALLSDFDGADEAPLAARSIGRLSEYRAAVTLRAPGVLATTLDPGPTDRLRLALSAVGGTGPLDVRLLDEHGALGEPAVTVPCGGGWQELAVDLAPLRGRRTRIELRADGSSDGRAVLLVGSPLRLAPSSEPLPWVLLYVVDTLRADRLGTYGYALPTDPHLRSIAAQGVVLRRMLAASNWTRPSVSTLMTSTDPFVHGNRTHFDRIPESAETLAERLAAEGYLTTSFITNYHAGRWSGLDQGVDIAREPPAYDASRSDSTLTSALLAAPVAEFLERHRDERLAVIVHTMDPHEPYRPDMEDLYPLMLARSGDSSPEADDSLRYDAEIRHNDRRLAELDDVLARLGRQRDTLLVLTSDHGEAFGEHGRFFHKQDLFQTELAVPAVLRWPAALRPGLVVEEAAEHLDLAPTVLGLLGLYAPDAWQGRDFSPLLRGGSLRDGDRRPLLADAVYDRPRDGHPGEIAVLRWPYKLVAALPESGPLVPRALFDLEHDPGELSDRLADPELADVVRQLGEWAAERVASSRQRATGVRADAMDPETYAWMRRLGYLK